MIPNMRLKSFFLDRPAIKDYIDPKKKRGLMRSGGLVRTIARRSMPRAGVKREKALKEGRLSDIGKREPGLTPRRWMGKSPFGGGLYKNLFFAWDATTESIVVGSESFGGRRPPVPGLVEAGGTKKIRNIRRRIRKVGDSGEIRIGGQNGKPVLTYRGAMSNVVYTRLTTSAMADRANILNRQLYGPKIVTVEVKEHPYMGPALQTAKPDIMKFFAEVSV